MKTVEKLPHLNFDEQGRPWIDDTNVKVIEVVLDHLAYGWNSETIQENHPHLSLAQVYAALAWYYDHQAEMDDEIERQDEHIRALRDAAAPLRCKPTTLPRHAGCDCAPGFSSRNPGPLP